MYVYEVFLHELHFYSSQGIKKKKNVLLQTPAVIEKVSLLFWFRNYCKSVSLYMNDIHILHRCTAQSLPGQASNKNTNNIITRHSLDLLHKRAGHCKYIVIIHVMGVRKCASLRNRQEY